MKSVRLIKILLPTVLVSIIFVSCKKEKFDSSIQIGVTEMDIKQVNKTLTNTPFLVDFDNDGEDDISFSTGIFGMGPNLSVDQGARALSLRDDLKFHIATYTDTLFSCTKQTLSNWPVPPTSVALTTVDYEGFTQQNDSCTILAIQTTNRVRYCSENDIINKQDNFTTGGSGIGILLSRSYVIQDYWDDYTSMDTLYRGGFYTSHYPQYLNAPFPKYIIFKFGEGKHERLGWIKLNGLAVESIGVTKN